MAGKKIPVETVLTGRDAGVKKMWEDAAKAAEFYTKTISHVGSAFNAFQALTTGGLILGAGAGLVGTFKTITQLGGEAEKTLQGLAGSFQVYGFATSYARAMTLATTQVAAFKREAAALPGTTEDFLRSFNINSSEQFQQGVKSIDEARKRSNTLTAVLLAKGVDSGQIGRDLGLMMRGHAGADVRSFMELKGQLGVKDAAEFNKKSSKERFALLDQVIAKNKDVIDAFGGTWEAVSSTSESFFKDMVRAGTAPLFEEAKNNLKAMNDYLEPLMPQIEKALTMGTSGAMHLMGQMVAPNNYAAEAATNQSAGMGFYEAVPTTLSQLGSIGAELMTVFSAVVEVVNSASNAIMGPLMAALPGLTAVLDVVAFAFRSSVIPVLYLTKIGFDVLGFTLTMLMKALSFAFTLIINIYTIVAAKIKGAVEPMVEIFHWVGKQIQDAFDWIAKKFHISGSEYGPEAPGLLDAIGDMAQDAKKQLGWGTVGGEMGDWLSNYKKEQEKAEAKRARDEYTANYRAYLKKGASVVQDFRGSKFSIEQKFAQGFDPGRVLTAVREDTQKMAQRRLSSGLTPLFGKT